VIDPVQPTRSAIPVAGMSGVLASNCLTACSNGVNAVDADRSSYFGGAGEATALTTHHRVELLLGADVAVDGDDAAIQGFDLGDGLVDVGLSGHLVRHGTQLSQRVGDDDVGALPGAGDRVGASPVRVILGSRKRSAARRRRDQPRAFPSHCSVLLKAGYNWPPASTTWVVPVT
jgi:hypothetical protein